ncbi:cytochrome c biogenesis heme-transporting ATPase CcmA [Testudinibacter sp. TR-2022]|uniref:cytochrome c biogenesis heme-transporting ATPase CcmA n=1 Tax=Testudinibacter sp. TR-2022 TaxID=2585029 RepID=UPI00111866C8|nr:cytochrome c biogenesis heme-transporting ATPase CcmA [Testudinibacter sp. TR-2022]TNH05192.1 cytochrome c biogenesis heme-transporting ATPase CcmA [Pasteurellaceae bacterium Phil11]TNH18426.1 cytochrome c biogenesis heme-transporting ATPase CcmA [Testudinibacter sp. TR-2022]TNH26337.1 cytochrome c biogenesis heme-transporting ATPase CcmA [Testudinibacter sp. TR-2022]
MFEKNRLTLHNLSCQRGEKRLFAAFSAIFESGQFVQLEGHNGIGKTSLLRILTTLSQPLSGEVRWNELDIFKSRDSYLAQLLYLGHSSGVKSELTPYQNLKFYQQISPCKTGEAIIWQALEQVGLCGYEESAVYRLSAGQQKRVALARLWLSQAPLWILDEPFTAIDKQGQQQLTALFEQHCQQGGIVILTSHQAIESKRLLRLSMQPFKSDCQD